MVGFNGEEADDDSDTMLIYEVKPVEHVEPILEVEEFIDLLQEHCGIYMFDMGFFCKL